MKSRCGRLAVVKRVFFAAGLYGLAACSPGPVAKGPEPAPSPEELATVKDGNSDAVVTVSLPEDVSGVWSATGSQGKLFDLVLFPNGQAVSTRVEGSAGARGERGFWRRDGGTVVIMFEGGWTDRLTGGEEGFLHESLPPGPATAPAVSGAARQVEDAMAAFVGVWRLNREPDGSYLYVVLRSDGSAFSTIGGLTSGRWETRGNGALATWPDGWNDLIEPGSEGWQKKAWVGPELQTLADLTEAERVGEKPFVINP